MDGDKSINRYSKPDPHNPGAINFGAPAGFTGQICEYAGATPPAGWLSCDGSLVNKSDYPELWEVCGDLYGTSTTDQFYLPDKRGRSSVGQNTSDSSFDTIGKLGGAATHQHTMPMGFDQSRIYMYRNGAGEPIYGSAVVSSVPRNTVENTGYSPSSAVRVGYTNAVTSYSPYSVSLFIVKT